MSDKTRREEKENSYDTFSDDYINDFNIISARECTGLIPALPQSDAEWDAYMALYATELNSSVKNPEEEDKNP